MNTKKTAETTLTISTNSTRLNSAGAKRYSPVEDPLVKTNNIVNVRASLYDHALPVHNPTMVTVWIRAKANIRKLIVVSAGTPSRNHSGTDASANDGNNPRPIRMVEMLYEKLNKRPKAQSPVIIINTVGLILCPPILDS